MKRLRHRDRLAAAALLASISCMVWAKPGVVPLDKVERVVTAVSAATRTQQQVEKAQERVDAAQQRVQDAQRGVERAAQQADAAARAGTAQERVSAAAHRLSAQSGSAVRYDAANEHAS